jgi:Tol biopolymer transport system component
MGWGAGKSAWTPRRRAALAAAVLLALAAAAAGSFLAVRYFRAKEGAAAAPPSGDALPASRVHEQPARELLAGVRGFVVWSSNRAGNHDIWRMELSDLRLTRLTQHPNTEYYPRISPDGTRIAFCRGHREWVSQRSQADWDVWVMDSDGRNARRVAERANSPSWAGPDRLVFQQDATRVVELDLATGGSRVLAEAGKGGLREDTALTTPDFAPARSNLAVTLRGAMRMTATIPTGGEVHRVAGGCQLYWSPGAEFLYYVDAGRMRNGFWKIDPETGARTEWFDAEGDYGHEYFPRLSADGRWLVYGASAGGHEHDTADYELFIWRTTDSAARAARLTWHTGNDCWPDIFIPAEL